MKEERGGGRKAVMPPGATFVAADPEMVKMVELVARVAPTASNVLVSGESGSGKDVVAHALHSWSERASAPFIKVDLASLPVSLIESELFGYERGAFTGAAARKAGRFELAERGTVFLDQVGELSPQLQAKLLRVVEERRFERLGGTAPLPLEARVVASAGADLEEAVSRERFRRDLFHRLGVFWIRIPPLRERAADVRPLASHFLDVLVEQRRQPRKRFTPEVLDLFEAYAWPGNVRELKGVVEHAVLLAPHDVIEPEHLPPQVAQGALGTGGDGNRPTLAEVEKRYIERVLLEVGGNQTRAADILGISRKSLWERRRRYRIE